MQKKCQRPESKEFILTRLFLRFRTNVFLIQKIVHNYIQKDILIVTTNTFRLPNRVIFFYNYNKDFNFENKFHAIFFNSNLSNPLCTQYAKHIAKQIVRTEVTT